MAADTDGNALIGFPRVTETVTISGGNWPAPYPLTNALLYDPLGQAARSADALAASTQFQGVFSKKCLAGLFGFVGHNAAPFDTYTIDLYSDFALTSHLAASGSQRFWKPIVPFGVENWGGAHCYAGQPTQSEIKGFNPTSIFHFSGTVLPVAGYKVTISTASNPDGHFDLPLFEAAEPWQISANPAPGFEFGLRTNSSQIKAYGGQSSTMLLPSQREWRGTIQFLKHNETMGRSMLMWKQHDIKVPFLFWMDPLDDANAMQNASLVTFAELSLAQRTALVDGDEVPVHFLEYL